MLRMGDEAIGQWRRRGWWCRFLQAVIKPRGWGWGGGVEVVIGGRGEKCAGCGCGRLALEGAEEDWGIGKGGEEEGFLREAGEGEVSGWAWDAYRICRRISPGSPSVGSLSSSAVCEDRVSRMKARRGVGSATRLAKRSILSSVVASLRGRMSVKVRINTRRFAV